MEIGHHVASPANMQAAYPRSEASEESKRCWHCGSQTQVVAAAGHSEWRRCTVEDCSANFRGPGVASFLVDEQRKCNLKADAERLAELKAERLVLAEAGASGFIALSKLNRRHDVGYLIAVYEECARRGLTFGGGR